MQEVRLGVIGCGSMAQAHMEGFKEIPRLRFVAASDSFPANLKKVVDKFGVQGFADGMDLIKAGVCDAIFIGTPHYFHPYYAAAALERDLHVLSEKPVAVNASAAARVNAISAQRPHLRYGAMFQMRSIPLWRKVHQIVHSGQLGKLHRIHWTITNWFRKQAYYDSNSWRATWAGEGGGVLTNQCPHNLDLLCWIAGLPKRVTARIWLGKYHNIEVEDDVQASFEYESGATGSFITSTGEFPGTNYFEIAGDRGRLNCVNDKSIELTLTDDSIAEYSRSSPGAWGAPSCSKITIEPPAGAAHQPIWKNFVESILDGAPLIARGDEGLASVELSNAIILSGLTRQPVDLPLDHAAFDRLLRDLIKTSRKCNTLPPGL